MELLKNSLHIDEPLPPALVKHRETIMGWFPELMEAIARRVEGTDEYVKEALPKFVKAMVMGQTADLWEKLYKESQKTASHGITPEKITVAGTVLLEELAKRAIRSFPPDEAEQIVTYFIRMIAGGVAVRVSGYRALSKEFLGVSDSLFERIERLQAKGLRKEE
ncbi:MAG: hypothetical protein GXO29_01315 [Thermotogae bacterium]|nr:hypothetical protein [Thermotogota bacterium]